MNRVDEKSPYSANKFTTKYRKSFPIPTVILHIHFFRRKYDAFFGLLRNLHRILLYFRIQCVFPRIPLLLGDEIYCQII